MEGKARGAALQGMPHCSPTFTRRPRPVGLPPGAEIAYDMAHQAISDRWDALAKQERRESADYTERLTSAVQARLAALKLPTPRLPSTSL